MKLFFNQYFYFIALIFVLVACATKNNVGSPADKTDVEAALQQYAHHVLAMNIPGLTGLFTAEGEIVNPGQAPIRGRAAIAKLLISFADYRVLAYNVQSETTTLDGHSAVQTGSYRQRVRLPNGEVVEPAGKFKAEWTRSRGVDGDGEDSGEKFGRWLLTRMSTTPAPS